MPPIPVMPAASANVKTRLTTSPVWPATPTRPSPPPAAYGGEPVAAGAGCGRAALASKGAGRERCKLTPAQLCELEAVLDADLPSGNPGRVDSNSNDQRQALATYNSTGRSHILRQLRECSA